MARWSDRCAVHFSGRRGGLRCAGLKARWMSEEGGLLLAGSALSRDSGQAVGGDAGSVVSDGVGLWRRCWVGGLSLEGGRYESEDASLIMGMRIILVVLVIFEGTSKGFGENLWGLGNVKDGEVGLAFLFYV
ncbi:hypothetical protein KM043_012033 [Ampulex compressa]|nr:hypothetical protein KM043_012033 [Ampulex compressa]